MNIVYDIAAWALSIPVVLTFWKAGTFKLTAPIDTIAAAGIGWVKDTSKFIVRLVAFLEVVGVIGLVVAHVAYYVPGFAWALVWAALAAAGLSLTMLAAALLHIVRKEIKYTWKINFGIAAAAAAVAVLLALNVVA